MAQKCCHFLGGDEDVAIWWTQSPMPWRSPSSSCEAKGRQCLRHATPPLASRTDVPRRRRHGARPSPKTPTHGALDRGRPEQGREEEDHRRLRCQPPSSQRRCCGSRLVVLHSSVGALSRRARLPRGDVEGPAVARQRAGVVTERLGRRPPHWDGGRVGVAPAVVLACRVAARSKVSHLGGAARRRHTHAPANVAQWHAGRGRGLVGRERRVRQNACFSPTAPARADVDAGLRQGRAQPHFAVHVGGEEHVASGEVAVGDQGRLQERRPGRHVQARGRRPTRRQHPGARC